jgi:hypothetical protein
MLTPLLLALLATVVGVFVGPFHVRGDADVNPICTALAVGERFRVRFAPEAPSWKCTERMRRWDFSATAR